MGGLVAHKSRSRWVVGVLAVSLASGCASAPRSTFHPPLPQGFTEFDWPRDFGERPLAGSLVQISELNGFRYLLPLSDCGLDGKILEPIYSRVALPTHIDASDTRAFNVTWRLPERAQFQIGIQESRTVELELFGVTEESIVSGTVLRSLKENRAVFLERCSFLLKNRDVYWIEAALKVESLTMQFRDRSGDPISISGEQIKEAIAGATITVASERLADGRLKVDFPAYIAFKRAQRAELLSARLAQLDLDESHTGETEQPTGNIIGNSAVALLGTGAGAGAAGAVGGGALSASVFVPVIIFGFGALWLILTTPEREEEQLSPGQKEFLKYLYSSTPP